MAISVRDLIENLKSLDIEDISFVSVNATKKEMLKSNLEQMYDGKTESGDDIGPTYMEDPFFKTPGAAQRYSNWKDRITPSPKRKKGVPNLFIDGTFHNSIGIEITKTEIINSSSFPKAADIESKFKGIYGLGGEYKDDYVKESLEPEFMGQVRIKTGL